MKDERRFAIYISHSWRPRDVDLNLQVWGELANDCELLVDAPEEPGADPPYYVNRIEELLRRSDLFLGVVTYRQPHEGDFADADINLRCSPYSLFEIRLAERADIPRLILYERSTGIRPPRSVRPWESYIPFDRGANDRVPEQRQWVTVIRDKIQQWKAWAVDHRKPTSYELPTSAVLVGTWRDAQLCDVLETCLRNRYEAVLCSPERLGSGGAFRLLREAGLVLAEFGAPDIISEQLYAAAHALGVPAIRLLQSGAGQAELPWILRGYPAGYQKDIIYWDKHEDLPALVNPRIAAMFRLSPALRDPGASDYLQSKRYAQFFIFISHTLKPPHRELVEHMYHLLKQRHITPFEYHQVNTAGIDWRVALKESLQKTTHFVALLSPDYEQSPTCTYELEEILAAGSNVVVFPFMVGGRSAPNPKLAHLHHMLLTSTDPRIDAEIVVKQVTAALDTALNRYELA